MHSPLYLNAQKTLKKLIKISRFAVYRDYGLIGNNNNIKYQHYVYCPSMLKRYKMKG